MIFKNEVTAIAQKLYPKIFTDTSQLKVVDQEKISIGDSCADLLCRTWQREVEAAFPQRFMAEISVNGSGPIDLLDSELGIAYELKYSHKNVKHEFYKDLFKILIANENPGSQMRITHFVFLCHHKGIASLLRSSLCQSTIAYMRSRNIEVSLVELFPDEEIFDQSA